MTYMKLTVNTDDFKNKVKKISSFTGRGKVENIMSKTIKLQTVDGCLLIYGCDFKHGSIIRMKADIITEGVTVVWADELISIANTFTKDKLYIELLDNNRLSILDNPRLKKARIELATIADGPSMFPGIPVPDDDTEPILVDRDSLLDELRKVSFAAQNKTNDFTSMVFFSEDLLYATDKFKMSALSNPTISTKLMFPKESISYFKNLSNQFQLFIEDNIIFVQDGDFFFMVRNPTTSPPEQAVRSILCQQPKSLATYDFNKEQLKEFKFHLKQIRRLDDLVSFYITQEKLWMLGNTNGKESTSKILKVMEIQPNDFQRNFITTFSISYLQSALNKIRESQIIFTGGTKAEYKPAGATGFVHIYSDSFQAAFPPVICGQEEEIKNMIGGK